MHNYQKRVRWHSYMQQQQRQQKITGLNNSCEEEALTETMEPQNQTCQDDRNDVEPSNSLEKEPQSPTLV